MLESCENRASVEQSHPQGIVRGQVWYQLSVVYWERCVGGMHEQCGVHRGRNARLILLPMDPQQGASRLRGSRRGRSAGAVPQSINLVETLIFALLAQLPQDSNIFRKFVTDDEGRHDL